MKNRNYLIDEKIYTVFVPAVGYYRPGLTRAEAVALARKLAAEWAPCGRDIEPLVSYRDGTRIDWRGDL